MFFFYILLFTTENIYISHGMARTNKNKNICRAQNMHVYPVRCVVLNSSVCTVIHYGQGSVPHQHFVQYVYVYTLRVVRKYEGTFESTFEGTTTRVLYLRRYFRKYEQVRKYLRRYNVVLYLESTKVLSKVQYS